MISHDDAIGYETLQRMARVERYNAWIYQEFADSVGQRILEVGCGIGNMTEYFVDRELLVGIDLLPSNLELIRQQYATRDNVLTHLGDVTDPDLNAALTHYHFDTVVCLNVLEHIEDDLLALQHMHQVLAPQGKLLLFVPAGTYMYGTLDTALGHFRRYERDELAERVTAAGFIIQRLGYLNLLGIPGWWLNSRVLKRQILPTSQLDWFNRLAPLFIRGERLLRKVWDAPFGQSLLCVAQRE